jgi:hypothetical protein
MRVHRYVRLQEWGTLVALPELTISGVSVVVRGAFNPAIFSPSWLLHTELIGETEYDAAKVEIVSPGLTIIQADWLRLQATNDSFIVSTVDPTEFGRTRDAAIGILQTLQSIPISVMGINREVHFKARTEQQWHAIGDALAPKSLWENAMAAPGLLDLSIVGYRNDAQAGRVQVQVQPSGRIKQGVFVSHNDHYDLEKLESPQEHPERDSAIEAIQQAPEQDIAKVFIAIEILNDEWENSMGRAEALIERIIELPGRTR